MSQYILDLYPVKAQFLKNEPVCIAAEIRNDEELPKTVGLEIKVYHHI